MKLEITKVKNKIILIDDNPNEAILWKYSIEALSLPIELIYLQPNHDLYENLVEVLKEGASIKCALVDYDMPNVNGEDVVRHIREKVNHPTFPLLMLSNVSDPRIIDSTLLAGANAYLLKPSSNDELCDLVQAIYTFWCNLNYY